MEENIIKLIKTERKNNKLSQQKISEMINISQRSYIEKEKGNQHFNMTEIFDIFSILNINLILNNTIITNNNDLVNLIKLERKNKKLSQADMFEKIGLKSLPTYANKENKKGKFFLWELVKICYILDINISVGVIKIREVDSWKEKL